ncbi:hypothetical protein KJ567_05070, partial [Candidatus Bipolaricaulota bacterium]|nr:hypothetical protein [Candidatus Bipolaricaulota bacterium]
LAVFPPLGGVGELDALGADVYLPSLVGWTPDLLSRLAELGIGVIPWTYNDPAQLRLLASTPGIAGIYTDYPQRLAPILRELREENAE